MSTISIAILDALRRAHHRAAALAGSAVVHTIGAAALALDVGREAREHALDAMAPTIQRAGNAAARWAFRRLNPGEGPAEDEVQAATPYEVRLHGEAVGDDDPPPPIHYCGIGRTGDAEPVCGVPQEGNHWTVMDDVFRAATSRCPTCEVWIAEQTAMARDRASDAQAGADFAQPTAEQVADAERARPTCSACDGEGCADCLSDDELVRLNPNFHAEVAAARRRPTKMSRIDAAKMRALRAEVKSPKSEWLTTKQLEASLGVRLNSEPVDVQAEASAILSAPASEATGRQLSPEVWEELKRQSAEQNCASQESAPPPGRTCCYCGKPALSGAPWIGPGDVETWLCNTCWGDDLITAGMVNAKLARDAQGAAS